MRISKENNQKYKRKEHNQVKAEKMQSPGKKVNEF